MIVVEFETLTTYANLLNEVRHWYLSSHGNASVFVFSDSPERARPAQQDWLRANLEVPFILWLRPNAYLPGDLLWVVEKFLCGNSAVALTHLVSRDEDVLREFMRRGVDPRAIRRGPKPEPEPEEDQMFHVKRIANALERIADALSP